MNNLVEKCLETISTSNIDDLIYDWEDSTYCIIFKKIVKDMSLNFVGDFSELYQIST